MCVISVWLLVAGFACWLFLGTVVLFFLSCLQRVCVVDGAGGDKRLLSPSRAERVKGDGRGSARGRRESRGWGTRPSGNAAQRNLGEPSKKRKWQRKQGRIEPSSGISNELTQLGHSINTSFLTSVCARATRTPALRRPPSAGLPGSLRPQAPGPPPGPGCSRSIVQGLSFLPGIVPLRGLVR